MRYTRILATLLLIALGGCVSYDGGQTYGVDPVGYMAPDTVIVSPPIGISVPLGHRGRAQITIGQPSYGQPPHWYGPPRPPPHWGGPPHPPPVWHGGPPTHTPGWPPQRQPCFHPSCFQGPVWQPRFEGRFGAEHGQPHRPGGHTNHPVPMS